MHRNSMLLFNKYAKSYFPQQASVLEIGARIPSEYYKALERSDLNWKYLDIGGAGLSADSLEMDRTVKLDYAAIDEYTFPIEDNSFDVVISGQVLEHVRKVWVWMKEVARVTKPGGYVITINPVSWPYHEAPVDCWRIYPEGMKALYDDAGLDVDISVYECLEVNAKRIIPGAGRDSQNARRLTAMNIAGALGWPVEASVDIITIGKKR